MALRVPPSTCLPQHPQNVCLGLCALCTGSPLLWDWLGYCRCPAAPLASTPNTPPHTCDDQKWPQMSLDGSGGQNRLWLRTLALQGLWFYQNIHVHIKIFVICICYYVT